MSRNISPDQHRRLHRKISRIEYKPTPISDLLRSIWKLSDIGLDLAFYAYFSKDI
ncbi:MAG: hypothetical protein OWQ48_03230 [Desulfurococcus sp.]|nr:hypothetical protein [Desulfurococcus sp.]